MSGFRSRVVEFSIGLTNVVIQSLKILQLFVSTSVIVLFWLIYPGALVVIATGVGLCYLLSSLGAMRDNRMAIWFAFIFSAATSVLSALSVHRFLSAGFDFLAGHHDQQSGFYLPPYLFLLITLTSTVVVLMHLVSWRWMTEGHGGQLS